MDTLLHKLRNLKRVHKQRVQHRVTVLQICQFAALCFSLWCPVLATCIILKLEFEIHRTLSKPMTHNRHKFVCNKIYFADGNKLVYSEDFIQYNHLVILRENILTTFIIDIDNRIFFTSN